MPASNLPRDTTTLDRVVGRSIFGQDAAGYDLGRLGYPPALFDDLFVRVPTNPDVLEIGAGTGLATQELLARAPSRLVAVEPDPALCGILKKRFGDLRLCSVNAPFPAARVEGPFDLAICAAAFHWLDPVPSLARVRDLLKSDGVWAMWWNSYLNPGMGDAYADRVMELLTDARIALPPSYAGHRHYSLDPGRHELMLRDAGFHDVRHEIHRIERVLDLDQLRALYASYSFVRSLPAPAREDLLDCICKLAQAEFAGAVPNLVTTAIFSARR